MKDKNAPAPTREELLLAFRETPSAFTAGLESTLRQLQQKEEEKMKKKIPFALIFAIAATLLLGGAVYAATQSPTLDMFKWLYGQRLYDDEMGRPEVAALDQSFTLGKVTYTLDDVVYADGVLYGSGTIRGEEGMVLIPEDHEVDEPAGYNVHFRDSNVPEGAPSYAQLARERGCNITLAKLVPEGYVIGGVPYRGDIGYDTFPNTDGTLSFWFEVYADMDDPTAIQRAMSDEFRAELIADGIDPATYQDPGIAHADQYTLIIHTSNWEITPEGVWLREGENNTWLQNQWFVTVTPEEQK